MDAVHTTWHLYRGHMGFDFGRAICHMQRSYVDTGFIFSSAYLLEIDFEQSRALILTSWL
jgi:hypothetical protein